MFVAICGGDGFSGQLHWRMPGSSIYFASQLS